MPCSSFVVPLTNYKTDLREMASHIIFVQPGLEYTCKGEPVARRTAGLVNTGWTHDLVHNVADGRKRHAKKLPLATRAAVGAESGRWTMVIQALNMHRLIRDEASCDWAAKAIIGMKDRGKLAKEFPFAAIYADYFRKALTNPGNDANLLALKGLYEIYGENLAVKSLYSLSAQPFIAALEEHFGIKSSDQKFPLGLFLPGAGGYGTFIMVVTDTPEETRALLRDKFGIYPFDAKEALRVMGKGGILKGYMDMEIGGPMRGENWPAGIGLQASGIPAVYDQQTGKIVLEQDSAELKGISSIECPIRQPFNRDSSENGLPLATVDRYINQFGGAQNIALNGMFVPANLMHIVDIVSRRLALSFSQVDRLMQARGIHFALAPPGWNDLHIGAVNCPLKVLSRDEHLIISPTPDYAASALAHEVIALLLPVTHDENLEIQSLGGQLESLSPCIYHKIAALRDSLSSGNTKFGGVFDRGELSG